MMKINFCVLNALANKIYDTGSESRLKCYFSTNV